MPRAGPLRTYAYVHILYLPYYMSQQYCWWISLHTVLQLSTNYPVSNLILKKLILPNPKCWLYEILYMLFLPCVFTKLSLLMLLVLEKWKITYRYVYCLWVWLIGLCQPKWIPVCFQNDFDPDLKTFDQHYDSKAFLPFSDLFRGQQKSLNHQNFFFFHIYSDSLITVITKITKFNKIFHL